MLLTMSAKTLRTYPQNLIQVMLAKGEKMKKHTRSSGRYRKKMATQKKRKRMPLGLASLFLVFGLQLPILAQDTVKTLPEVNVTGRADAKTPMTTTTLNQQELDEAKIALSLPYMLELQPSVVVSGENGFTGGTRISIRGVNASRINVNINGITLNDPESQEVFWYNIPNLGGMAQSLQVQRGAGVSVGGSPSFGAAMNLQTLTAGGVPYGNVELGFGSWNTLTQGISFGTGLMKHGFAFEGTYNGITTDGFIRGSGADQQSLFLTASHYGVRSMLRAVFILGHQTTGITWNGATADQLDLDRRYNPAGEYFDAEGNRHYYKDETDNYNQRHYQLYYTYIASKRITLDAAFDFTHGDGYYENYRYNKNVGQYGLNLLNGNTKSDFIHRKEMYNSAYTGTVSARYTPSDKTILHFGETFVYYDGNHFGNLLWSQDSLNFEGQYMEVDKASPYEWYRNKGIKQDNTFFARINTDLSDALNLYAEAQMRIVDYAIFGIEAERENLDFHEKYLFFNPKVGTNYQFNDRHRLYFMAAVVSREPTRSDIKETYLEGDTIKAETMLDIELGYNVTNERLSFNTNLYAMLYRDQLTPSGNWSPSGYALMENVDRSYRLGLELAAGYRFSKMFSLDGNLTVSTNRIIDYTCMVTLDDWSGKQLMSFGNTHLALSPSVIGAAIATLRPFKNAKLQLIGKYVGKQYADNSSREEMKVDPYLLLNARASYIMHFSKGSELEFQLAVNNILDHDYRLSAYSSSTVNAATGDFTYDRTYFQQPGINLMGRVIYRF